MRLAAIAVALLIAMLVLAPDYGAAQTAADADAFRATVADADRPRYAAAAVLDLLFALFYALLALATARRVASIGPRLARMAWVGAAAVVVGAVLDEIENALLLANLSGYRTLDDDAVDRMTALGGPKWALGVGGAIVLVGTLLAARRGRAPDAT